MGKCKCCCAPIPFMKYMNLTADFGFPLLQGEETQLFSESQAGVYCVIGPIKNWLNLSTGEFTVQETGLYSITTLNTFIAPSLPNGCTGATGAVGGFVPSAGDRSIRVKRTYSSPRCNGRTFVEIAILGESQYLSVPRLETNMTLSAVQPLAAGDILTFFATQTSTGTCVGTCILLFFELEITKLSPTAGGKEAFDPKAIEGRGAQLPSTCTGAAPP